MKVLIVGAGMGGLTLAAFLEDSHVEYEIVEKASDWSHMGFLIGIWDSGRDIVRKLRLDQEFDRVGSRVLKYQLRDRIGRILKTVDLRPLITEFGSAMTLLDRGDLHRLLLSKVDSSKIRMSTSLDAITQHEEDVTVKFSDGSEKTYDVVIGADGVHSKVRSLEFADAIEQFENWRIWYTWIGHEYDTPTTVCEYVDTARFIIVCTGLKKTTAWFFAPADHSLWDKVEGRASRLRELFANDPALLPAIEKLRDEDIMPTDMMRVKLRTWWKGRVALLGDAAHSLGPLAGMGSTMAMEDAYTLAAQLIRVSDLYPLPQAFKNYEKSRRIRVREAEIISRNVKFGTLVTSRFLRTLENILMVYVPDRLFMTNLSHLMRQEI